MYSLCGCVSTCPVEPESDNMVGIFDVFTFTGIVQMT